jgi:hypothetical protein
MQQQGKVTVRAAVLSHDESSRYFGVALADKGIQSVWLSVENGSDGTLNYLPATTDADYYTPPEASRLFQAWLPGEADKQRERLFAREAMPEVIVPGQKASGFVLTHREGGLKFLRASFVGSDRQFDFRFVIPLGGRTYAAQRSISPLCLLTVRTWISLVFAPNWKHCLAARLTKQATGGVIRSILSSLAAAPTQSFRSSSGDGGLMSRLIFTVC